MTNEETLSQMIAGTLLVQELLIRHLEAREILKRGAFGAVLQDWMDGVSPERHSEPMYQPVYVLMKKLSEVGDSGPQSRH
jgi:hypothetical protein